MANFLQPSFSCAPQYANDLFTGMLAGENEAFGFSSQTDAFAMFAADATGQMFEALLFDTTHAPEEGYESPVSASSPESSATDSVREVPFHEAPAESPDFSSSTLGAEVKIELVEEPLRGVIPKAAAAAEGVPVAVSSNNKRKHSASRPTKETDNTMAVAPVQPQPLSKRARANQRHQKREAHNRAERERRDDMKEGFARLRQALPTTLCPDRKNTVDLLQAASDYITDLQRDADRLRHELASAKAVLP